MSTYSIYKIYGFHHDMIYYGSTKKSLYDRLKQHENAYRRKNYISSSHIIETGDFMIELIETSPECEFRNRERYYVENFPCVNKNIPGRTMKEYYADNRELLISRMREHYAKNKEDILATRRQYYIQNRPYILRRQNKYNNNNKTKIKERVDNIPVINCPCGGRYKNIKSIRNKHMLTNKHIKHEKK